MRIDSIGDYHVKTIPPGGYGTNWPADFIVMRHDGSTYIYARPYAATDAEIASALAVAFDVETVQHNANGFWSE